MFRRRPRPLPRIDITLGSPGNRWTHVSVDGLQVDPLVQTCRHVPNDGLTRITLELVPLGKDRDGVPGYTGTITLGVARSEPA